MSSILSTCSRAILEVLFPSCCVACGHKLVQGEQAICSSCLNAIVRTEHMFLPNNGIDMLFADWIKKERRVVHYEHGVAFAFYNRERGQLLRSLIERGKFGTFPNPMVFHELGRVAAMDYLDSELFDDVDVLVPVPLHPRRLRQRGFNQAEYICKGLYSITKIPIDTSHLVRTKNNPHQSRSNFDKRHENVRDLFAMRYPEEWKNKHILLVDDVITSGATLFECMKQMTPIRGCRISVFALGWAHN